MKRTTVVRNRLKASVQVRQKDSGKLRPITPTTWVTDKGSSIPVDELVNEHLLNIVAMLRRLAAKAKQEELGKAIARLAEVASISDEKMLRSAIPTWPALLRELNKRGLNEKGAV